MKNTLFALFGTIIFSTAFAPTLFAEAKAYDVVKYEGQIAGLKIAFDYGNGYPDASKLQITEVKSGKTTRLGLDDSGELHFVSTSKGAGEKKVVLKMGMEDQPPPKLEGTYTSDGKTIAFTLVRK